jgi:hypothetical protein
MLLLATRSDAGVRRRGVVVQGRRRRRQLRDAVDDLVFDVLLDGVGDAARESETSPPVAGFVELTINVPGRTGSMPGSMAST